MRFFQTKKFTVDARQMTIKDLETYIDKEIPIIVSLQARSTKKTDYKNIRNEGHNVTVIGYTMKYIFFADPVTQRTCYLPKAEFIVRRHEQEDRTLYNNFGVAVYGKKPVYNPLILEKIM
ncbi:MAG: C39 family peptidase [bacterium]